MEEFIASSITAMGKSGVEECSWLALWQWEYWISFVVGVVGSIYLLVKKDSSMA